jgi:hypothetical protein
MKVALITVLAVYLTVLHIMAAESTYLLLGETYVLAKIDHPHSHATTGTGYNADELTSFLDAQMKKGK